MKYLLDTNACIGWLRQNQRNLVARIKQENCSNLAICSVVVGELIYGVERSAASHRADNRMRVEQLRRRLVSFSFDDIAADHYGKVRAALDSIGTPIGPNDLMIASIALAHNLTLVTHNLMEFGRVPGLKLEDWQ